MKTDPMNTYTLGTLRMLGFLYKHTTASATDLAGVLGKSPSTLTKKGEKLGQRIAIRKGTLTIRDN